MDSSQLQILYLLQTILILIPFIIAYMYMQYTFFR